MPSLPDVRTIAESGYPGFETSPWYGILVAAGTPAPIVERLHKEIVAALAKPETTRRIVDDGGVAVGNSPAEFAALIAREERRWSEVVRSAGVKPA